MVGGARLNLPDLPEFKGLIGCSSVTDHYLFQCLISMFFGYLQAVGAEKQALLLNIFNVSDTLQYPVSIIRPTRVGRGTIFNIEILQWMENGTFNLVFFK